VKRLTDGPGIPPSAGERSKANAAAIGRIVDVSDSTDEVFRKERETTSPARFRRNFDWKPDQRGSVECSSLQSSEVVPGWFR
jgi:hypothetical protein